MTDRVTLFDIAQAAGVSTATVSRVITGRGPVSDEMRRRVEAAAEALQVNAAPRGGRPAPSPWC
jgi:LacI family transcriptional regulator